MKPLIIKYENYILEQNPIHVGINEIIREDKDGVEAKPIARISTEKIYRNQDEFLEAAPHLIKLAKNITGGKICKK